MWEQVKLLEHLGKVSLNGVVTNESLDMDTDDQLLSLCNKVSISYQRVVLIYVQYNEKEVVDLIEDGENVSALNKESEMEVLPLNKDNEEEVVALKNDSEEEVELFTKDNENEVGNFTEDNPPHNHE